MTKTVTFFVTTALLLVATSPAQADLSEMTSIATFGDLDQLRSQNTVLAEAVKNAELKNKLNNINQDDRQPSGLAGVRPQQAQVQLVSGYGDKMTASISLPTGGSVIVSVGSKIADLGIVKSISINNVTVQNNKQVISLPFADQSGVSVHLPGTFAPNGGR